MFEENNTYLLPASEVLELELRVSLTLSKTLPRFLRGTTLITSCEIKPKLINKHF